MFVVSRSKPLYNPPMIDHAPQKPDIIQYLLDLGALAHNLQLERGYTSLFVDSASEFFGQELRQQKRQTDAAINKIAAFCESVAQTMGEKDYLAKKCANLPLDRGALDTFRNIVQAGNIDFPRAVNGYTYEFLGPILDLSIELALHIEGVDPKKVSAYSNLLQWKERTGRERAWGAHGFCSHAFRNREFSERMISMIEEQGAYRRAFFSIASDAQSKMVEEILGGYIMQCLDLVHEKLANTQEGEDLEALSPVTWFELLTGKIDRLYTAEQSLVRDLGPVQAPTQNPEASAIPSRLEPYMPLIQALPAFSKLSESELASLLTHADLRRCEKGKLLFLQDEPLSRFYVILEGWVKLFKGSDSGDEAVLQMLSTGDTLMEAAVFLNIPSAVSAQVVQQTILLSLPAPIVRQSLLENTKFALNMIDSLSMRSQSLIRQIEQSRLKTATERVGWFLLRLGMEQSGGKGNVITLPYDKSTTASFLDMTPETFSRTLKQFRNKGFSIQNDKIIKPAPEALCSFCDETLAEACIYKDQKNCPQTYMP